jgi:uncharacterized protein YjbJ (UPF0337 family)
MSGKSDEIKGRIKEAAGSLTGNEKLRQKGKAEQAVAKVEQAVEQTAKKVKETVHKAVD